MKYLFSALVTLLSLGVVRAGKYNLTGTLKSSLVVSHDPPTETCLVPGVCFPTNQTVPGQTLWYWCGFYTTHKTIYTVTSTHATNNFSGTWLIRRSVLESCALVNLPTVESCPTIPESSCSGKKSCTVRLFGLVFFDEMCLMIINNKAGAIVASVQVNNWFSSSRYYGTVFTVLFAVLGISAILSYVGYQMYKGITSPVGKPKPHVKREDELTEVSSFLDDPKADGKAAVPVHKSAWYHKIFFSFRNKSRGSDKSEP